MNNQLIDINDGKSRCKWAATDPMLAHYHDLEWGQPIDSDSGHLERMALEVFQCGLSWKIVLVKRDAFREAFDSFAPARVARFRSSRIEKLCGNPAIIRNRMKLEAIVNNAKVFLRLADEHGSYLKWFYNLATELPRERKALYPLFKETFKFMGPETTKCYLMGVGKIPAAHDRKCWRA